MPNNRDEQNQLPPRFVKMGEIWAKFGFGSWAGVRNDPKIFYFSYESVMDGTYESYYKPDPPNAEADGRATIETPDCSTSGTSRTRTMRPIVIAEPDTRMYQYRYQYNRKPF